MTLRTRLAVVYASLALLVALVLSGPLFAIFRSRLRDDLRARVRDLAATAATGVDVEAHARLRSPADESGKDYAKVKRQLQAVRQATGGWPRYVYTMRVDAAGRMIFIVDAETDPDLVSHLGDEYTEPSYWMAQHLATLSAPATETGFSTDRWGTWLSGYAPLITPDGHSDGVLGVDVPAADVLAAERRFLQRALIVVLTTIVVASAVGWWLGGRLAAPVVRLKEGAERISHGDLSARVALARGDELGELADMFDAMAQRLEESHAMLEARVAERTAELAEANELLRWEAAERRRAEEARQTAQERLELSLRGADLGTWDWDVTTGRVDLNARAVEMLGFAPDEVTPQEEWIDSRRHPDDAPSALAALRAHLEGHTSLYETEQRFRTKSGDWVWVLTRGRCVSRGPDGMPLRVAGTHLDITERKRLEEELRAIAVRDGLTGLANRRAFEERLEDEWRRAARALEPLSLVMCDVDHFKRFNDRHGHAAGDECLRRVAAVLRDTFRRATEFPARWGGEEFAVVLSETDAAQALEAGERLRRNVEEAGIERGDAISPVVTVSVGVATLPAAPDVGRELLAAAADEALYEAKRQGRNRVVARPVPSGHPPV